MVVKEREELPPLIHGVWVERMSSSLLQTHDLTWTSTAAGLLEVVRAARQPAEPACSLRDVPRFKRRLLNMPDIVGYCFHITSFIRSIPEKSRWVLLCLFCCFCVCLLFASFS